MKTRTSDGARGGPVSWKPGAARPRRTLGFAGVAETEWGGPPGPGGEPPNTLGFLQTPLLKRAQLLVHGLPLFEQRQFWQVPPLLGAQSQHLTIRRAKSARNTTTKGHANRAPSPTRNPHPERHR